MAEWQVAIRPVGRIDPARVGPPFPTVKDSGDSAVMRLSGREGSQIRASQATGRD